MREDVNLVDQLANAWKASPQSFWRDGKVDYNDRYDKIASYLVENVHRHTLGGAFAAQLTAIEKAIRDGVNGDDLLKLVSKNQSWLTDHGPEHIDTVILRASKLVNASDCILSPYEIFVLLTAIQFHDVGNIYGREEHEKKITDVLLKIGNTLWDDDAEKRLVRDIAAAHGGKVNGDEDTIRHLKYPSIIKAQKVRPHLLAAILRFADELAEDYTRASRFALNNATMLRASEVYHQYADRLREVNIYDGAVELRFDIDKERATKTFGKGADSVFLLDEIFERTLKMHREHIYCMRFMRQQININLISVEIGIYKAGYLEEILKFTYNLKERGFPLKPPGGIHDICDDLKQEFHGNLITGESMSKYLETL